MESEISDGKNALNPEMCPEILHVNNIPMEICVQTENMLLCDSENENEVLLEKLDDLDYTYSCIIRYLLFQTVMITTDSERLHTHLRVLDNNQLMKVSEVITITDLLFDKDFGKICSFRGSEVECVEFYLSRCVMLCGEPTFISFLLVATYVTDIFLTSFRTVKCFRKLHLCEFIFDVLYRRIFCKVFNANVYNELMSFCEFFNESFTVESLSELENVTLFAHWKNQIKNSLNIVGERFSLNESEIELFRKNYSIENNREHDSPLSSVLMCEENVSLKKTENGTLVCSFCDSKCYNYMDHLKHFV
ncbi:hypothetical protein NPIL_306911 [Nephila pilipes]|uniref:Uncharacterized protein n=1 Tax=Nephila pilipes TaxID=299642 RepID=A0A8X6MYA7_NEPPI|nr:hypothetical protein NPIL_306911 [Nephila pilipes]